MFRKYEVEQQMSLINSDAWMDKRTKKKLDESWAPVFFENVYSRIDESPFSVLYDNTGVGGAPNFPVRILLSLELIKHMQDLSDEELMEKYDFDYLVNYALGNRALGAKPMSKRTLYYFRERLYLHTAMHPESEDLIFGQFKSLTQGLSKAANLKLDEQRMDTTFFMSNIKKAGRISLAFDVLTRGAKKIPERERTEAAREILSPTFRREILYKARSSETESKLTLLLRLCKGVLDTLAGLGGAADETRILTRLLEEQAVAGETGEVEARDGKAVSPKSMQSAHDEDATYRKKNGAGHKGYVAGITETCSGDNPFQVITDYAVRPNAASDVEIAGDRLEAVSETGCGTLFVDGGMSSADIIKKASGVGIEMRFTNLTGSEPDPGLLGACDFEIAGSQVVRCPEGHAPDEAVAGKGSVAARFDRELCAGCPCFEICPSKLQKKNATVRFKEGQMAMSLARHQLENNFVENVSKRAAIEGTNSALKRTGMGKLRVRGKVKCGLVCGLKILGQNVKRFIRFAQGLYPPKTQGVIMPSRA